MSKLRQTATSESDTPCPTNGTAYLMVYNAVKQQDGLIWGKLHGAKGEHCAIGSLWATNPRVSLYESFIDEVAMVNDSVPPTASPRTRRTVVLRWLRWKLNECGMPGFKPSHLASSLKAK